MAKKTIGELVLEYFKSHPKQPLEHGPVVDWVTEQYLKENPKPPRDPWRATRKLHEEGLLIRVKKGIYMYDPDSIQKRQLEDFTPEQKDLILKRDDYRCVICGRGRNEGFELHIDHIKPKNKGGQAILENGQTLCSVHNFRKKQYEQTETGKKMFIRLYNLAKKQNDHVLTDFCRDILAVYDKHDINGHIEWKA